MSEAQTRLTAIAEELAELRPQVREGGDLKFAAIRSELDSVIELVGVDSAVSVLAPATSAELLADVQACSLVLDTKAKAFAELLGQIKAGQAKAEPKG